MGTGSTGWRVLTTVERRQGLMDHSSFIWSAYTITMIILLWTALSPLVRQNRLRRSSQPVGSSEKANDSHP